MQQSPLEVMEPLPVTAVTTQNQASQHCSRDAGEAHESLTAAERRGSLSLEASLFVG